MIQQPEQHKKSTVIPVLLIVSAAVTAAAVLFVLSFVVINGIGKISLRFLFTAPKGFDVNEGGIFPAIISTIYLGAVAGIAGLVCALPVSISLCFFVKNAQLRATIRLMLYALAAVPSIILGLFGYTVFVKYMHFGKSLIAGGLTLGIMIFLFLEQRYTIMHIVLPLIKADIIRAAALYIGFAIGATAPIILTAAVLIAPVPTRLTDPVMALPYHLYLLVSEGIDMESAYATACVLLVLVLCINTAAVYFNGSGKTHGKPVKQ